MKMFFLRELSFLAAPAFLLTHFKGLKSRFLALVAIVFLAIAMTATLSTLALHPSGLAWLGVGFGFAVTILAGMFVVASGV